MVGIRLGGSEQVSWSRLVLVGLLALVASVITNTVIRFVAVALLAPDPAFGPLQLVPTILFTVIGVLGGVIVFAVIARFAKRPIHLFRVVAIVFLLVSLIPDVLLLVTKPTAFPGITTGNVVALMLMHIVAGVITIGLLTTQTRRA